MNDGHAVFLQAGLHFKGGLVDMGMEWDVVFQGELGAGLEYFGGAGVMGVGADGRGDEGVALPVVDEFVTAPQALLKAVGSSSVSL